MASAGRLPLNVEHVAQCQQLPLVVPCDQHRQLTRITCHQPRSAEAASSTEAAGRPHCTGRAKQTQTQNRI